MNKVIYLEPDCEITDVINRIKSTEGKAVVLALPRGSTLAHSIVNLKLLKRVAEGIEKTIFLASSDKIAHNLASQVGLKAFNKVSDAEVAKPAPVEIAVKPPAEDEEEEDDDVVVDPSMVSGIKVKTYNKFEDTEADEEKEDKKEELIAQTEDPFSYENEAEDISTDEQISDDNDSEKKGQIVIEEEDSPIQERPRREIEREEQDEEEEETEPELEPEEEKEPEVEEITPIFNKKKIQDKKPEIKLKDKELGIQKKRSKLPLIIAGSAIALVLILAGLFYYLVPYATASLTLKTADYKGQVDLTIDKNAKETAIKPEAIVPGKLLETEKEITKTYNTSGTRDAGEKAKGTVTISNSLSSDPQIIAGGTKLTSADGNKVFLLVSSVKVPGATISNCKLVGTSIQCDTTAGVIDTDVIALENGADYNVAPTTFSIAGYSSKVTAANKAALAGGLTKQIKFVTDDDLKKAEKELNTQALADGKADIKGQAETNKIMYDEKTISSELISKSSTKKVDEESDKFDYTIKVKSYAIAFDENIIKDMIISKINDGLDINLMLVNPDRANVTYSIETADNDAGTLKVKADFTGKTGDKIDKNAIQAAIKAKKSDKAEEILKNLSGIDQASLNIWPRFMPYMPILKNRIIVKFEYSI